MKLHSWCNCTEHREIISIFAQDNVSLTDDRFVKIGILGVRSKVYAVQYGPQSDNP